MLIVRRLALASALALATIATADAGTATGTLAVQVTVQEGCQVSGGSLTFGTYTGGQTTDLTGEGSVSYANCPAGTLTVALDNGLNANNGNRRMTNGSNNFVRYALFRNSTRTNPFGTGSQVRTLTLSAAGSGSIPVFGTILSGQLVPAGTYTDTVGITLTF